MALQRNRFVIGTRSRLSAASFRGPRGRAQAGNHDKQPGGDLRGQGNVELLSRGETRRTSDADRTHNDKPRALFSVADNHTRPHFRNSLGTRTGGRRRRTSERDVRVIRDRSIRRQHSKRRRRSVVPRPGRGGVSGVLVGTLRTRGVLRPCHLDCQGSPAPPCCRDLPSR